MYVCINMHIMSLSLSLSLSLSIYIYQHIQQELWISHFLSAVEGEMYMCWPMNVHGHQVLCSKQRNCVWDAAASSSSLQLKVVNSRTAPFFIMDNIACHHAAHNLWQACPPRWGPGKRVGGDGGGEYYQCWVIKIWRENDNERNHKKQDSIGFSNILQNSLKTKNGSRVDMHILVLGIRKQRKETRLVRRRDISLRNWSLEFKGWFFQKRKQP